MYSHAIPFAGCRSPGTITFAIVASVVFGRSAQLAVVLLFTCAQSMNRRTLGERVRRRLR